MIELAALALLAVVAWVVLSLALALVKVVLWVLLLPLRLLFGLLLLPFLLLKVVGMAIGGLVLLIAAPILAIALVAADRRGRGRRRGAAAPAPLHRVRRVVRAPRVEPSGDRPLNVYRDR